jgi:hypothetical protein
MSLFFFSPFFFQFIYCFCGVAAVCLSGRYYSKIQTFQSQFRFQLESKLSPASPLWTNLQTRGGTFRVQIRKDRTSTFTLSVGHRLANLGNYLRR